MANLAEMSAPIDHIVRPTILLLDSELRDKERAFLHESVGPTESVGCRE